MSGKLNQLSRSETACVFVGFRDFWVTCREQGGLGLYMGMFSLCWSFCPLAGARGTALA